ncbi:uncharacterized protein YfdQ (DUF2303 family) [Streptomyces sp. TLI_235]|nr:DUF2303 family protein [Streptomyces sp. TLI_235]PBC80155.1 uncharacterized protein YfdQ (DUF2303 family) [Streptomyces sp. TLI_235]
MTTVDNAQAIITTATRAASPSELEPGKVYGWLTPNGSVQQIDLTGDEYRDAPARKSGTTTTRDVASFLAYFAKHSDPDSEIYADAERLTITAVLDANMPGAARWGRHRLVLALRTTEAWRQWIERDGKLLDQAVFAEHLEDHTAELVSPPGAEMLEIAQSIQGATKAEFQSGTRLQSGQRQLSYIETTTAKAGAKGTLEIPETFEIGLVPFEGSAPYKLSARFRYRIENGGTLRLAYKLDRPGEVVKAAFADILAAVAEAIDQPVMNGSPAA